MYKVKAKRVTPAADWAGVGSLNHAATARKYAFITKETTTMRRRKMLPSKSELINSEETKLE